MNPVNLKEFDLLLEDILTIGKGVEKDCAIVMEKLSHKYPEDKIIYKWRSQLQKYLKWLYTSMASSPAKFKRMARRWGLGLEERPDAFR